MLLSSSTVLCRATEYKAKVVNFMVTHYWVDNNFDGQVRGQGELWVDKIKFGATKQSGCPLTAWPAG
jgi:hypothetical protein